MRYLCVHCDHRFEHEGDEAVRCPKCMRKHGIEKLGDGNTGASAKRPRWLMPAIAAGILALVGGGYAWWAQGTPAAVEGDPPLRPLSHAEVRGYLKNAGVSLEAVRELLEPGDAVEQFAEQADGDGGGPSERAEAVTAALRKHAKAKAFIPWPMDEPRQTAIRTAAATAKRLDDGAKETLYPLEVAALAVSALRTLDVDAMVAEAWGFADERAPVDPSGHFGYYVVAVWDGEVGEGAPVLFDPYGGRELEAEGAAEHRVLTDVQAVAAAATHRASHALVHEGATDEAYRLSEAALKLDDRSPSVRTVRGIVLLRTGGINEGLEQLRTALQLRADGPRHNSLAMVHLANGSAERASSEVVKALDGNPDYAAAHATLAQVHLAKGETDRAGGELKRAHELAPDLHTLPMLWAQYYMRTGEAEKAVEQARAAVERRPHDWQTRLQAGQVMRQAGYYDEMRQQAQQILEIVPADRQARVRKLIEQVLGPTAFDEPMDDLDESGASAGLPDPSSLGDLSLGKGSRLLSDGGVGGGGGGAGPSLLGDDERPSLMGDQGAAGPGSLPSPGGGSKLRLRDPGDDLQLNLGE